MGKWITISLCIINYAYNKERIIYQSIRWIWIGIYSNKYYEYITVVASINAQKNI